METILSKRTSLQIQKKKASPYCVYKFFPATVCRQMARAHFYLINFLSQLSITDYVPYPILKISPFKMENYGFGTHVLNCISKLLQAGTCYSAIIPNSCIEMEPLCIVEIQLNVLMALGIATRKVRMEKTYRAVPLMPDVNIWCPQTKYPTNAMARVE